MTAQRQLEIRGLQPCPCERHAWALLRERDVRSPDDQRPDDRGLDSRRLSDPHAHGKHLRLRVPSDLVAWFAPREMSGHGPQRVFSWVAGLVGALGHEPLAVIIESDERHLDVRLLMLADGSETEVPCEPALALLAARHIGLPIYLRTNLLADEVSHVHAHHTARTGIPAVFHDTLARLGLIGESSN